MGAEVCTRDWSWLAVTLETPPIDPLAVAGGRADLCVYWEQPGTGEALAGFGCAAVEQASQRKAAFDLLQRIGRQGQIRWVEPPGAPRPFGPWFGGLAFDMARSPGPGWPGFPVARWLVPELLVWTRGGRSFATAFAREEGGGGGDEAAAGLEARLQMLIAALPRGRREPRGPGRSLEVHADEAGWGRLVATALSAIEAGALTKVVAARAIAVSAREPFDPIQVLARLRVYAPTCTTFLFGGEGAIFAGATPEVLCRVRGRSVETEALAGSASPGESEVWIERDKERREHCAVTEAIIQGLTPLCDSIQQAAPSVMALPNVVHLRTPVRAVLKPGVSASDVVRVLHPTPAVGGTPRERALSFLQEHEGLDRGWYAGVVGWMGEGDAELMVALRSAVIQGREARVFVGAGVVAGSTAEGEWRETEAKSLPMLQALGGGHAGGEP